jgi:hypothetical protein
MTHIEQSYWRLRNRRWQHSVVAVHDSGEPPPSCECAELNATTVSSPRKRSYATAAMERDEPAGLRSPPNSSSALLYGLERTVREADSVLRRSVCHRATPL